MKTIHFFGNLYRQLTEKAFWADCEIDIFDRRTGEWVPAGPNDIIWLYDSGWPAAAYNSETDIREAA